MRDSYVLINCEVGYEKPVLEELKQFENIADVTGTFGPYDIIVKVKEKPKTLREIVEQIRQIQHITSTLTLQLILEPSIFALRSVRHCQEKLLLVCYVLLIPLQPDQIFFVLKSLQFP